MLPTTYYGNQKQLSIGDGYMMYMLLMIFLFNLILNGGYSYRKAKKSGDLQTIPAVITL